MNKIVAATAIAFLAGTALAQAHREPTPQQQLVTTCNFEAKTRDLTGEARNRFVSTCLAEGYKRLQEVMRSCNVEARGRTGAERTKFLAECLRR